MSVEINIIGTGSKGNCAIIDGSLMVDCGVTKDMIGDTALRSINAVLITHAHGDHVNLGTLNWILRQRPELARQLIVNSHTLAHIREKGAASLARLVANVVPHDYPDGGVSEPFLLRTRRGTYTVETFEAPHDVPNNAYVIATPSGESVLWVTDASSLVPVPDRAYDVLAVEGNYAKDLLEADLFSSVPERIYRAERNVRHLSVEEFESFVAGHRAAKGAKIIQLHISDAYGRVSGLADACPLDGQHGVVVVAD